MAYTNCKTRIISLAPLNLPAGTETTDEQFRQIYQTYISKPSNQPGSDQLRAAVLSLTTGIAPPVAFPTETVYGLGADATNLDSIAGIFAAKGRPSDNPLIVHVSSKSHLDRLLGSSTIPDIYTDLIAQFWPGPLTILLPVPEPSVFASNVHPCQKTIGFRVPSSPAARFLISVTDRPIAAPSANSSGKPSPTTAQHVFDDLDGKINFVLDGGPCTVGVESTVVDGLVKPPVILRPGGLSRRTLREWAASLPATSSARVWATVENAWEMKHSGGEAAMATGNSTPTTIGSVDSPAPRAPGMKYKHYSPAAPMYLVTSARQPSTADLKALITAKLATLAPTRHDTTTVGFLTSSYPPFFGFPSIHHDGTAQQHHLRDSAEINGTNGHTPAAHSPNETHARLSIDARSARAISIALGSTPVEVANRLFAALRRCDEVGCNIIFAELPSMVAGSGGSGKSNGAGSVDNNEEYETVVERMRKAATEVVVVN